MTDISDVLFGGDADGWSHIFSISITENVSDLSPGTFELIKNICKELLRERIRSQHKDRKQYNEALKKVAMEQLSILKPATGRQPIKDLSGQEFLDSKCWKHASAVFIERDNSPELDLPDAISKVAKNKGVDASTIRRALRESSKNPKGQEMIAVFRYKHSVKTGEIKSFSQLYSQFDSPLGPLACQPLYGQTEMWARLYKRLYPTLQDAIETQAVCEQVDETKA